MPTLAAQPTIVEYPIPTSGSYPQGITAGPDGNLWFVETAANKIGKISTAGLITEYSIQRAGSFGQVVCKVEVWEGSGSISIWQLYYYPTLRITGRRLSIRRG